MGGVSSVPCSSSGVESPFSFWLTGSAHPTWHLEVFLLLSVPRDLGCALDLFLYYYKAHVEMSKKSYEASSSQFLYSYPIIYFVLVT